MAFPDYFEKNNQSAALLLRGISAHAFKAVLENEVVAIAVDKAGLASREGQAILDLSVRLIARLYPTIAFAPLAGATDKDLAPYVSLARSVNSKIDFEKSLAKATRCLVVGSTRPRFLRGKRPFVIYAGSRNWLAFLSTARPAGSGASANPFGAGVAACVAVANIFRSSFKAQLPLAMADAEVAFSALQMAPADPRNAPNPALKRFDLGITYLVGAGAIGNGFIWTAGRLECTGALHLVDGEKLAKSNLQRYAMTVETDVDEPKVELAKRWLSASKLKVHPHAKHWEQFAHDRGDWAYDQVAVAVDTARTRINVQAALPRAVFNSWTQAGEAGLSRHGFAAPGACLACLYMPDGAAPNYDELIARALHLPETRDTLLEIRKRLQLAVPNEREFLDRVAAAAGVPIDELLPFLNKSLQALYIEGICGGAVVTLAAGGHPVQQAEVPMSFQSALAGILLAADLVAERLSLRPRLPTKTQISVLTALAPIPSNGQAKVRRCFCADDDFIAGYKGKYPGSAVVKSKTVASQRHRLMKGLDDDRDLAPR